MTQPSSASYTISSANADLAVTKSGPPNAVSGTDVTYTLTATNNGPSDASGASVDGGFVGRKINVPEK